MEDHSYNGWPNYETWAVHLWLTNDETTHYEACSLAGRSTYSVIQREDALRQLVGHIVDIGPNFDASLASDLIGCALSQVDWRKLREALTEG